MSPPKVYIDANVLVYYLARSDRQPRGGIAKNFFSDITNGKWQGIICTFTITEYVGATKEILQKKGITYNSRVIQEKAEEALRDLGVAVYDTDELINIARTHRKTFNDCNRLVHDCVPTNSQNEWRTIGAADSLTLILAEECRAEYIATFDNGFRGIEGSPIRPLVLI